MQGDGVARNEDTALPLEFQLLAACCDHSPDQHRKDRLPELASSISDWESFDRVARRQQLRGFVHAALSGAEAVPNPLKERWAQEARKQLGFNLHQARETGILQSQLESAGIECIVLKGMPLASRLYGSLSLTRSNDIDLLVRPEQAERALEVLGQQGHTIALTGKRLSQAQARAVIRHEKEIALQSEGRTLIDLHWRLVGPSQILSGIKPFDKARMYSAKNLGDCRTLGLADEFAYLCVHVALSEWAVMKWLCDINALIAQIPPEQMPAVLAHAEQLGAGPSVRQALVLRAAIFGRELPPALAQHTGQNRDPQLLAHALGKMSSASIDHGSLKEKFANLVATTKAQQQLYPKPRQAILGLWSQMFALPDLLAVPLPRALDFLYIPLRPILWVLRRLGFGTTKL